MLTALAVLGAASAVGAALLALLQRDVLRVGMFAVASQAGMILAAFGMGGYSPALFILFTGIFLAVVFFLAAGNLTRGFRSRELADCGGGRRRMPRTTLALGGWALGISGLSLNTYNAVSATFRDALPNGGHVSGAAEVVVAIALLAATALTALYAFRVYFVVASGDPARRRGFDVGRLREVDARLRVTALVALAGAAVATLVGLPGLTSFTVSHREIPGLTFSRFVFYGATPTNLGFDPVALVLVAALAAGGAVAARWLFAARGERAETAPATECSPVPPVPSPSPLPPSARPRCCPVSWSPPGPGSTPSRFSSSNPYRRRWGRASAPSARRSPACAARASASRSPLRWRSSPSCWQRPCWRRRATSR